ncbi:hypothetical protein [Saccharicrinis aurantiacus]|uniref:hypothetical protein n=1 Tax=Saccharicrinis aurantiacus TaxID=1849719 RepID=UPI00094FF8E0|nr:hypothetical protein [Saccharicrinis aurantiacus]
MNKIITILVCLLLWPNISKSQNNTTIVSDANNNVTQKKVDWDMSLTFKTKNVFRGLLPSPAPAFSMTGNVTWNNWLIGVYGGSGIDGYYQETDFIIGYHKPRYNIHLEYYYNYTVGITDIPNPSGIFDFNKHLMKLICTMENKWSLIL